MSWGMPLVILFHRNWSAFLVGRHILATSMIPKVVDLCRASVLVWCLNSILKPLHYLLGPNCFKDF